MREQNKYLSIRTKIFLTLVLGVVLLFGLLYILATETLTKSYLAIEEASVVQDLGRASNEIDDIVSNQLFDLNDWSPWEEMYNYTKDYKEARDYEFESSTLFPEGIIVQDQHAFIVSDLEGTVILANVVDLKTQSVIASSSLVSFLEENRHLTNHKYENSFIAGIVQLKDGPAIYVSKPVLHNDGTGPLVGSVTIIRYLDKDKIEFLSKKTSLAISIFSYDSTELPQDVALAKAKLAAGAETVVTPNSEETIRGYKILNDVTGKPILILQIEAPRPVYLQGKNTSLFFIVSGSIGLLFFGFFVLLLLEKFVIRRFISLTRTVEKINTQKDISIHIAEENNDDIGRLGAKINQMLTWLSVAQQTEQKSKKEAVKLLKQVERAKQSAEQMVEDRTDELRNEKARLLASINSLSFGFIATDKDNTIIVHNPTFLEIFKLSAAPQSLADLTTMLGHDLGKDINALINRAKLSRKFTEIKQLSYENKFLRLKCTPVLSDKISGKKQVINGFVLIVDDITEEKNIERSREEFFSIASHELRTPLTAIRWNTFMLLSDNANKIKPEQKHRLLDDIHNASIRLVSIVSDFLEISRLEQKKIVLEKVEFDVVKTVSDCVQNLAQMALQKGLTLEMPESIQGPVLVIGDSNRVKQVLDNLVGNALKYTDKGTIGVSIEKSSSYVKVLIKDSGIGISSQNQTRLFKKFQQANEDMLAREDSQSAGLGLYISKLVMSEMGGLIALERSVLGEGSTFSFTLPLSKGTSQGVKQNK